MNEAEAMAAILSTGAGKALLGCEWGTKLAMPDDLAVCDAQATKRIVLYDEGREAILQFCPKHASRVVEETTQHG